MVSRDGGVQDRIRTARRIVIKIGTRTISRQDGVGVDQEFLNSVAEQVRALRNEGRQVLVVSSGAIGMGSMVLRLEQKSQSVAMQQACASIGQPLLMQAYRNAFTACGIVTAQILVTRDQFNHRKSFNNLKTSVEKLLKLGVVPVINENDSVSTEEIGHSFGDNDQLSAFVASKISADLLILLSDVDGLYDSNPRNNSSAQKITYVEKVEQKHLNAAEGRGSSFASGGMTSKLEAVRIAGEADCLVILAHGRHEQIISKICRGDEVGTLFKSSPAMKNRQRWIKNAEAQGAITVDPGAMAAMLAKGSLLPRGITAISGVFQRGDVVLVNSRIKLISAFNSSELGRICGKYSNEVRRILGEDSPDVIARPEDMVVL